MLTRTDMRISLKTLLNMTVVFSSFLAFFMGRESIGGLYTFLFLALLLLAVAIEWRELPHPPRILINLATLAALLAIFARVRRNYIVEALMEALLLMTAVKMLEKKTARDYVQIAALSLAVVVSTALLSVEKTFIVYCFGMGLLCTLTLILSTWFAKEPDALLSLKESGQLLMRALGLFGIMLPLSLLLFFASPRAHTPLFGARGQYGSTITGFSDQVSLGDAGTIQTNNKLAFRAVMEPLEGGAKSPYWRGMILDLFDGSTWIASRRNPDRGPFIPDENSPRVSQEIFLEPGNRGYLFALDQPLSVTDIDAASEGDGIFRYRARDVGKRLQYNAVSVLASTMKPANPDFSRNRLLSLPQDFIPRLQALVDDMTQGMTGREKIDAILAYLSPPNFEYSLEGLPQRRDALEQFIFSGRKGNCEYFASAMGVMLRMAEIPARLVAGYKGGIYNASGGYYVVQEEKAHIWVEAWDEELKAWGRYDPTPIGVRLDSGLESYGFMAGYLDVLDYQWSRLVVNYNWEVQAELLMNLKEILRNPHASLTPTKDGLRRLGDALSGPVAAFTALVGCIALFSLARALKNRRPEMILLRRFLRAMKRHGYTKHDSEGLEEFLAGIGDPELRALALPFVRRFDEFYYKDRPLDAQTRKYLQSQIKEIANKGKSAAQ